ncbi:MAG: lipid-A-disaccharide synthase [Deltaproteobacteria bacterium]|nr:lipid-A-disaccharide synthase [Deltaproteobacteria bacterium]MBW2390382.1 lipid-A-disaccharide synthase [Deltaproteobacteria bacterium]
MTTLLISAGDASGDLHAAEFVRAFRAQHPDARILGLGGDEMRRAGVELVVHQRDLAVGGLLELGRSLAKIVSTWRAMVRVLARANPDLVVLVDSGGFNLPFARRVRRRCGAKILYFVAPQVWAWRPGRIRKLARRVDRMAVIFPFEPAVYAETELPVEFVGHPLIDKLAEVAGEIDRETARTRLGCGATSCIISLFPGSRSNEVRNQLPLQLAAAALLHTRFSDLRFLLAIAPTVSRAAIDRLITAAGLPAALNLEVVHGRSREVMLASDVVLAKPGTVTVELALLARPMVVVGRVNPVTALVLRRAVRVPFYAMPNLVAGREIVPEFLQEDARPEAIAQAVAQLMDGPTRERQLKDLAEVSELLSSSGAARRASEIAGEMLEAAAK